VCAANLSARKADYKKFEELNVEILGIANTLPFSQKAFADSLKLQYPLLSDTFMKVAKAYGVEYGATSCVSTTPGCATQKIDFPGLEGRLAKRSFFLVDKDGIVRGKWIGEDLPVFSTEMLLKAAREIVGKPAEDTAAKKPSAM
jgi:peroxiredoxin